jgi:hypothetical protein
VRRSASTPLVIAVAAAALAAGCAGAHPWSSSSVCEVDRTPDQAIPADAWIRLLVKGWDATTRRATAPAVDCSGAQVRWDAPALACEDGSVARAMLPDRPLVAEDVVVVPMGDDFRIVWVVTNRFASGDGLGPAAVVEVKQSRIVVRALASLRANPVRPKLRLARIGEAEVLVAEGEVCTSADPASCARSARVMPLVGPERYAAASVVDAAGTCVAPALFHLGREEGEALPSGWRRRYRLDATLDFTPAGAVLREQVVVHDVDPKRPNTPARLFRRAEADAEYRFDGKRFVTTGPTLWTRMMEAR